MPLRFTSVLSLLALFPLLTGCTMDITRSEPHKPATPSSPWPINIKLQTLSSAPRNTLRVIDEADLRSGDLLFSSSINASSLGIRLFSAASVSHVAVYIGNNQVAEAVGSGVQIVSLKDAEIHSDKIFALRMPGITQQDAQQIREFAIQKTGKSYNYKGIIQMAPFMVTKHLCSLNPFSKEFRQQCVKGLAAAQLSTLNTGEPSYFCSQFVLAAFEHTGHPLTLAASGWVSPGDLLHMREGDIATLAPTQPLMYIGHLKRGIYLQGRQLTRNNIQ